MKNLDTRTMKYIMLTLFICLFFMLLVQNAYKYIPEVKPIDLSVNIKDEYLDNTDVEKNDAVNNDINNEENETEQDETIDEVDDVRLPLEAIEENLRAETNIDVDAFREAKEFSKNKEYAKAIELYEKTIAETNSLDKKSSSYFELAKIYAIQKRNGTALANAQKAYNIAPTVEKELLLARLYYKVGQENKAMEKIYHILRSDIVEE